MHNQQDGWKLGGEGRIWILKGFRLRTQVMLLVILKLEKEGKRLRIPLRLSRITLLSKMMPIEHGDWRLA
jgi:hypothetical protein